MNKRHYKLFLSTMQISVRTHPPHSTSSAAFYPFRNIPSERSSLPEITISWLGRVHTHIITSLGFVFFECFFLFFNFFFLPIASSLFFFPSVCFQIGQLVSQSNRIGYWGNLTPFSKNKVTSVNLGN